MTEMVWKMTKFVQEWYNCLHFVYFLPKVRLWCVCDFRGRHIPSSGQVPWVPRYGCGYLVQWGGACLFQERCPCLNQGFHLCRFPNFTLRTLAQISTALGEPLIKIAK